jgi:1-aminocyclopropane-1-carboxylate deaminase/D-cysteine desulfhydrase-like pyridoxal-dependent ACC family enzyme
MAALVQHARSGELRPDGTVVFLHTGGMPALFTAEFAMRYTHGQ